MPSCCFTVFTKSQHREYRIPLPLIEMEIPKEVKDTRSVSRVSLHTFFLVVLTVLSFTGNSLVCLALYRNRRLRTITNLYVLALAMADIILAIFVFPFSTIASALRQWPFPYNFCQFNGFVSYYWGAVSIFTLTLTAINRYFCIVKPQHYQALFTKKWTVVSLVLVWIISLFLGLLITFEAHVQFQWHPTSLYCREIIPNNISQRLVAVLLIGFCVALSSSCIVYCYVKVFKALRRHNNAVAPSLQTGSNIEQRRAEEVRTSRILFVAVVGVCACWLPTMVMLILEYCFSTPIPSSVGYLRVLSALISSWINPIIYGVMNRTMRKEFLDIIHCRKGN